MDSVDAAAVVTASPNKVESKAEELKRKSNGDAAPVDVKEKNGKEDEPIIKKVKLADSAENEEPKTEAEPDESGDKSSEKSGDEEAEQNGAKSNDGDEVHESDEGEEEDDDEPEVNGGNVEKQDLPKEETAEPEAAEESKE